ncbi:hypothetical protein MCHI_003505 [Candidatus Magnetoovum chiemensis]|nr:hypothetical protein MCHI_003505 [Candidatus Magnetoovum chiemensis]
MAWKSIRARPHEKEFKQLLRVNPPADELTVKRRGITSRYVRQLPITSPMTTMSH